MKVTTTIDIDSLLVPIAGESNSGKNLRLDTSPQSLYYQIKDARNRARTIERQQMEGVNAPPALSEWETVQKLALQILQQHSKDMEVCAWLLEAQLRLFQFAGLRDGLFLLKRLGELYWDTFYPMLDEEGYLARVTIITGLNGDENDGTLIVPISSVKLTDGKNMSNYALWEYQQAVDIQQITNTEKKQKRIAEGGIDISVINAASLATIPTFYQQLAFDLQNCLDELSALNQFFDVKCGRDAPPLSRIKNVLLACLETIKIIGKSAFAIAPEATATTAMTANENALISGEPPTTRVQDREKAFAVMLEIAGFFQLHEPHSPVSFMLKKAVRWGRTSLPNLLAEIIHDESILKQFYTQTGIEEEAAT